MFKNLIIGLIIVIIICMTSLYAILNNISPYIFWNTALILFYSSVMINIFSIFTLFWVIVRYLFANITDIKSFFYNSMRQALIIWIISCTSLILMHLMYFNALILWLLILIWILIEVFYYWINKIWENDI